MSMNGESSTCSGSCVPRKKVRAFRIASTTRIDCVSSRPASLSAYFNKSFLARKFLLLSQRMFSTKIMSGVSGMCDVGWLCWLRLSSSLRGAAQVLEPLQARTNASDSSGVLLEVTRPTSTVLCLMVWGHCPSRSEQNRVAARDMFHELLSKWDFEFQFCRLGDDEWRQVAVKKGVVVSAADLYHPSGAEIVATLCRIWQNLQDRA